jgi:hypothetical protein
MPQRPSLDACTPNVPPAEVRAEPSDIDFNEIGKGLDVLGYSVLRTARSEQALISTASALASMFRDLEVSG